MAYENVMPCWPLSSSSAASSSSSASRVWQSSGNNNKSNNALLAGGSVGVCSNIIDGKAHSRDVYGSSQGGVRFATAAGSPSGAAGCSPALIRQSVVIEGLSNPQRQRVPLAEQQYEQQQRQQQQVMGLKLGKRTYHEDSRGCSLISAPKKQRAPAQPPAPPTCQVEGCKADLTESKGYHRRHRVCQMHSKTPKNMVDGIEQRFCQQCSRFHVLVEFDDGKRSCRRRLAGHNERRRKPSQPEPYTLPAALGCSSIPIFPGAPKGMMQQQHQQHLLDGTFLLNNGSWPCTGLHKLEEDSHIVHARTPIVINTSSFYAQNQNRSKQEMAALQDSIVNQGVYQFLLAAGGGGGGGGGASSLSTTPPEPGAVLPGCAGALSLLSAEPTSGSAASSPFAQLQLQPTGYHHHHHQQQQQQNQFSEFLQFQKVLQPLPGFDLGVGAPRASAAAATTVGLNLSSSS